MGYKLENILDANIGQEEVDVILEKSIQAKFDADWKLDLKKKLAQEYNLSKESKVVGLDKRKSRNRFYYVAAAAVIALGILALNIFGPSAGNAQEIASSYLASTEILHGGSIKGQADNENNRMKAISAFNDKNYHEAEQHFSRIEEKTEDDLFYSGIASIYNGKYTEAIDKLSVISESASSYQTEGNWYLAIAYILNGDDEKAKDVLSKMKDSTWNQDKTKELLNALR